MKKKKQKAKQKVKVKIRKAVKSKYYVYPGPDNEAFCSPECQLSFAITGEMPVCCYKNNN